MSNKDDYIKIYPSNGVLKNKNDEIFGDIWMFRPGTGIVDKHWFESSTNDRYSYLCIEIGEDQLPVNCFAICRDTTDHSEWERVPDEDILRQFDFCCTMLRKRSAELVNFGDEILGDMLPDIEG